MTTLMTIDQQNAYHQALSEGKLTAAEFNLASSDRNHWKPDICIYHGDCEDGFTAAWCVWKKWPDIEFYGAVHGKPIEISVRDKNVLMVDFAPKKRDMALWETEPKSLVILDHHKTAQADLEPYVTCVNGYAQVNDALRATAVAGMPPIVKWFDMAHSGAWLAWKFINDGTDNRLAFRDPPWLVRYVEDRDLWTYRLGDNTRYFSANLRAIDKTFPNWDWAANNVLDLLEKGQSIWQSERKTMMDLAKEMYVFTFHTQREQPADRSYIVADTVWAIPVVNAPYHFASDLANHLLKLHPDAPFAACWFRRGDGKIQWSLRSEDGRTDVSEIARKLGGGGHRNASGFECSPERIFADTIIVPEA